LLSVRTDPRLSARTNPRVFFFVSARTDPRVFFLLSARTNPRVFFLLSARTDPRGFCLQKKQHQWVPDPLTGNTPMLKSALFFYSENTYSQNLGNFLSFIITSLS